MISPCRFLHVGPPQASDRTTAGITFKKKTLRICWPDFRPGLISKNKINPTKFGKIYFNKTIELISKCKIVLLRHSTAMHFAILFQKPLMFLSADKYIYHSTKWTKDIAGYFNKKPINISVVKFNKEIFYNEMKFNKKIYSDFKKDFIVDIENPNKVSHEIIFNSINKNL